MTVSRGKKTFLFESKNWNLFQERCTIRCTIRYRYLYISGNFIIEEKICWHWSDFKTMKRNHFTDLQASRGKKLLSDWKKWKLFQDVMYFCLLLWTWIYIYIRQFYNAKNSTEKPPFNHFSLGGNFTFATTQYTHLVFIIALFPFSSK